MRESFLWEAIDSDIWWRVQRRSWFDHEILKMIDDNLMQYLKRFRILHTKSLGFGCHFCANSWQGSECDVSNGLRIGLVFTEGPENLQVLYDICVDCYLYLSSSHSFISRLWKSHDTPQNIFNNNWVMPIPVWRKLFPKRLFPSPSITWRKQRRKAVAPHSNKKFCFSPVCTRALVSVGFSILWAYEVGLAGCGCRLQRAKRVQSQGYHWTCCS